MATELSTQEVLEKLNEEGSNISFEKPLEEPTETTSTQPPAADPAPSEPSNTTTTPPATPPTEPPAQDVPEEVIFSSLSKLTGGKLNSKADFEGLLAKFSELEAQAAQGFEPKFKDERTKWAHKVLSTAEGDELDTAMRTLRALKFNPEGKQDKDILFESFLLNPMNADLSEAQALKLFEADFNRKYGNLDEDDVLGKRELALKVKEAKDSILKVQNEVKVIDEQPRMLAKEIEASVKNAVSGFRGLKVAFSDNPGEGETLNVAIANPQELAALESMVMNPNEAYNQLVSKFETEKGFDYNGLIQEIYERNNHKQIRKLAYEQGIKKGELNIINKARNASDPKQIGQVATPAAKGTKSFYETFAEAQGQQ